MNAYTEETVYEIRFVNNNDVYRITKGEYGWVVEYPDGHIKQWWPTKKDAVAHVMYEQSVLVAA